MWFPAVRDDVTKLATPFVTVPVPRVPLTLSTNVTVPVTDDGVIVVVKVVELPKVMLVGFAANEITGVTWLIVTEIPALDDAP